MSYLSAVISRRCISATNSRNFLRSTTFSVGQSSFVSRRISPSSRTFPEARFTTISSWRGFSTNKEENPFRPLDSFPFRHLGPRDHDIEEMLKVVGYESLDALTRENVPKNIQATKPLNIGPERGEFEMLEELRKVAKKNQVLRSFIGMGYYGTKVPAVIQRNLLENPGWYTPYTPYQAEISQGRLEALLYYQTVVADLTKMDVSNASLLDEGTAAAEAMGICFAAKRRKRNVFYVSEDCHTQTIDIVKTRAETLGVNVIVGDHRNFDLNENVCGVLVQYPNTYGDLFDYESFAEKVHSAGALLACATDLLALTVVRAPGEFGADIALGSAQRFGVPMGYGGPHAGFFAVKDELKRLMPGRLIGVSKDRLGKQALRMALQTREQHIRRETATSNICTAQALLANMSSMYAIYHGPEGLKAIGERVHRDTVVLAEGLKKLGFSITNEHFFDTIRVSLGKITSQQVLQTLLERGINIRHIDEHTVGISLDETIVEHDLQNLLEGFAEVAKVKLEFTPTDLVAGVELKLGSFRRSSTFLEHPAFSQYRSESEMMRFLKRLENRDLSLTNAMIPLGSCTMKLNATAEMLPITWPEFSTLHPFVPLNQAEGYLEMMSSLSANLCDITGLSAVSLQPNSGAQGEYAGLRAIRSYFDDNNQSHRNICLIPSSAHGTNPASAVLAGFKVVVVKSDKHGNIDQKDLFKKAEEHSKNLACLMVTYPSTHGVYEEGIKEICDVIHANGGQVYMDGANMNAQAGLCSPGQTGADVCHLNLHKTFCIPHGGGGPGMGPIAVASHLAPYLPNHPVVDMGGFGGSKSFGSVAAAPFSSSSILPISYMYIQMMGSEGIKKATQVAILSANYMAKKLSPYYDIVYSKANGLVAHEFIIDFRPFKKFGIEAEDVAKRLMDYGYHAPTLAFPIQDTLMIEPTESETREALDHYCEALISIRKEIEKVEKGEYDPQDNPLVNAPHTAEMVMSDSWAHSYPRQVAAFPTEQTRLAKYWPPVTRIDSVYGDRNLVCTCPPIDAYEE